MTSEMIISDLLTASKWLIANCDFTNAKIATVCERTAKFVKHQQNELDSVKKKADEWHREAELNAAEIINLQADKESLIAGQETLQKALAEKIEESENQSQNFKVLISDHRTLQQSFDNLKGLYEAEKAKVEKAKEKSIYFAKELQTAKAELKETTEKFNCQQYVYADLSNIIKEKNAEIERLTNLCQEQNTEIKRLIETKNRLLYNLKAVCKEKAGEG